MQPGPGQLEKPTWRCRLVQGHGRPESLEGVMLLL